MQDKLIHAIAYAVMAFLFWQAARRKGLKSGADGGLKLAIICVVFCSLYGLSDEWHQSFVTGRDASFFDWLADTVGAFLLTMVLYKRESVSSQIK